MAAFCFQFLLILPTNEDLKEEARFSSHYGLWQVVLSFLLFLRAVIALTWFNKITTLGKMKNCPGLKVLEVIKAWTSINFKCGISLRPSSRNSILSM